MKRIVDEDMKKIMITSCALLTVSKGLAVLSPWFIKGVVDMMAVPGTLNLTHLWYGIGAFGLTRLISIATQELRTFTIADFI